jgi:hypothetical protein
MREQTGSGVALDMGGADRPLGDDADPGEAACVAA